MDQKARAFALSAASALALTAAAPALAEDLLVTDQDAFASALDRAEPGDRILLADGEWRDFQVVLDADGADGAPITLAAQTPGGVRLTGRSNLAIGGEHLVVSGLTFTDSHSPTDEVISFRLADGTTATDSRLTQTVIEDFGKPKRSEQDSWVVL